MWEQKFRRRRPCELSRGIGWGKGPRGPKGLFHDPARRAAERSGAQIGRLSVDEDDLANNAFSNPSDSASQEWARGGKERGEERGDQAEAGAIVLVLFRAQGRSISNGSRLTSARLFAPKPRNAALDSIKIQIYFVVYIKFSRDAPSRESPPPCQRG